MKKFIGLLIAILVIVAGFALWKTMVQPKTTGQTNNPTPTPTPPAKAVVYTVGGTVTKTSSTFITFTLADKTTSKTLAVNPSTLVSKRVTTKTGTSLASSNITAVKVGSEIIVYTKDNPSTSDTLTVDRIEIVK